MCRFALTSGSIVFEMYYILRFKKRSERMQMTAIRHSGFNFLQLLNSVSGNISLREILPQSSLPHVPIDADGCFTFNC